MQVTLVGVSFATLSNVGGRSCSMSFLCSYPPKFLDAPADAGFWLRELFGCCFQLPNFVNKMTSAFSKVASTFGLFPCLFRYQPDVFFSERSFCRAVAFRAPFVVSMRCSVVPPSFHHLPTLLYFPSVAFSSIRHFLSCPRLFLVYVKPRFIM